MNLNEAFEQYRCAPTNDNMELLYPFVRERVTRVIGKYFKQEPDEDLIVSYTSDVLMRLDSFKGDAQFSTWVTKVAHNFCLDEGRNRSRSVEDSIEDLSPTVANSLSTKVDSEKLLIFEESFRELTDDERLLVAGKLEGLSGMELADKFGISRHAVELRWARLKERLREILPL